MEKRKRSLAVAAAVILIMFAGCATTMTTRSVIQPLSAGIEQKKITEAVTYVLIENGFDLKLVNESMGLITTEWREVKSGADTAANVLGILSAGMGSGSYTSYSRAMMIQVKTANDGYQFTPK